MSKPTENTIKEPTVTVRIVPGKATEHQKKLWRDFWTRLVSESQRDLEAESEAKK